MKRNNLIKVIGYGLLYPALLIAGALICYVILALVRPPIYYGPWEHLNHAIGAVFFSPLCALPLLVLLSIAMKLEHIYVRPILFTFIIGFFMVALYYYLTSSLSDGQPHTIVIVPFGFIVSIAVSFIVDWLLSFIRIHNKKKFEPQE